MGGLFDRGLTFDKGCGYLIIKYSPWGERSYWLGGGNFTLAILGVNAITFQGACAFSSNQTWYIHLPPQNLGRGLKLA